MKKVNLGLFTINASFRFCLTSVILMALYAQSLQCGCYITYTRVAPAVKVGSLASMQPEKMEIQLYGNNWGTELIINICTKGNTM